MSQQDKAVFWPPLPSKPSISSGHAGATFEKRGRPLSSGLHVVKCGRASAVEFAKRAPVHTKLLMRPFQSSGPSPGLFKGKEPACPLCSFTTPPPIAIHHQLPPLSLHSLPSPSPFAQFSFCDKLLDVTNWAICLRSYLPAVFLSNPCRSTLCAPYPEVKHARA